MFLRIWLSQAHLNSSSRKHNLYSDAILTHILSDALPTLVSQRELPRTMELPNLLIYFKELDAIILKTGSEHLM